MHRQLKQAVSRGGHDDPPRPFVRRPASMTDTDTTSQAAAIISKLIALAIPAEHYILLNCVAEALDWLIENDRPGLSLNASVRDLMDKRIVEQRKWRGA